MKSLDQIEEILEDAINLYEGICIRKNTNKAIKLLTSISDQSVDANFCLGRIYWNKKNNTYNNQQAIYWYTKAAELGHPFAQLWLGHNYMLGTKSNIDAQKSAYWYKKAANQNIALAQYHTAICYNLGFGLTKNLNKTIYYMKKAAKNNFFDADVFLAESFKCDNKKYQLQIKKIQKKYKNNYLTDPEIAFKFAKYSIDGYGIEKNENLAFKILNQKFLKNNIKAQLLLAQCYEKAQGTKININKAKQIYKRLCKKSELAKIKLNNLNKGEIND